MGVFDASKIYVPDTSDAVNQIVLAQNAKLSQNEEGNMELHAEMAQYPEIQSTGNGGIVFIVEIVSIIAGAAFCVCILMCLFRCSPIECNQNDPESESLLHGTDYKR